MCNIFILRDRKCIEFRNTNNLSQILYTLSVAPHNPWNLCTVGSSFLLYEDRSKKPRDIHCLDFNESKPKFLKEKSLTTSLSYLYDMIKVRNGGDELIVAASFESGIHCYSTTTKTLKWRVAGKLPGMQEALNSVGLATDRRGHLFVSDGYDGNRCIQMFSISDGWYLGCLIKRNEQGLGCPRRIFWHSASHSLVVAHSAGAYWYLSMINIEYWLQFFWFILKSFEHLCNLILSYLWGRSLYLAHVYIQVHI